MISVSPGQQEIMTVLRSFLLGIVPDFEVIQGQSNRVPEPKSTEFMVMTPLTRPRLGTNIDAYLDAVFIGSISADILTVTEVKKGSLKIGSPIFGVDILDDTSVVSIISGSGGIGTYRVNKSQDIESEVIAAGESMVTQKNEIVVQLDIHSKDVNSSADAAEKISTLFRDPYATSFFYGQNPKISPLYASDPRQAPFQNGEQQYETRWTLDAHMQADQTVSGIKQQFASVLKANLFNVEAEYPPQ